MTKEIILEKVNFKILISLKDQTSHERIKMNKHNSVLEKESKIKI